MSCQVTVAQGVLQGRKCETFKSREYMCFEGIPYAKPPVGKLRFRCPVEPDNWSGVRDATKPGNKCMQLKDNPKTPIVGSEDCLYLNVYTPNLPNENQKLLPVFFFIHGGKLLNGSGDYYRPDYFMQHDVILVTINYRLHIFGFLCLNIPEAPGNAGLKDTIMALEWVKENIINFSGDPNNITVYGESAGTAIGHSFLTSKMADGLFNKMIAQSGCSTADLFIIDEDPIEKARNVTVNLGKNFTDPKELYEFLIQVPAEELMYALLSILLNRHGHEVTAPFLPVIEKEFDGMKRFFDQHPSACIMQKSYKKVPILFGTNTHEASFFVKRNENNEIIFEDFKHFIPYYANIEKNSNTAQIIKKKLKEHYFKGRPVNEDNIEYYVKMISDFYFQFEILSFIEAYSKDNEDVYFYKFAYEGSLNLPFMKNLAIKGTGHGDVTQYEFYTKNKYDKCNEKDKEIIEFINETWCNFAKTGKPSWSNQKFDWLPYTPKDRNCLIIDKELKLVKNEDYKNYLFWKNLVGIRSNL